MKLSKIYSLSPIFAAALLAAFAVAPSATAITMIGDTLTFERLYPDTSTAFGSPSVVTTVVAAGTSDVASWLPTAPKYVSWDPEADSITFDFIGSGWIGDLNASTAAFDGFRLSLTSGSFTSVTAIDSSTMDFLVTLDSGTILVDVKGSGTSAGTDLTLQLRSSAGNSLVPDTGSTILLLGAGLLGLAAIRRKFGRS